MAIDKTRKCRVRLTLSAALVVIAALRVVTTSFVFSGNATLYYRFVRGMFRTWLITGSFAALAAVIVVPVFWQGSRRQWPIAGALFALAALVLPVCISVLREF